VSFVILLSDSIAVPFATSRAEQARAAQVRAEAHAGAIECIFDALLRYLSLLPFSLVSLCSQLACALMFEVAEY
jgi:hypothetical protein